MDERDKMSGSDNPETSLWKYLLDKMFPNGSLALLGITILFFLVFGVFILGGQLLVLLSDLDFLREFLLSLTD